jgi:alanyl-tRNA synthetase
LKPLLSAHGGRGGGNAQFAQGSLPSTEALDRLLADLDLLLE